MQKKRVMIGLSQFENKLVDDTIILVYGLGDGSYVEKLLKLNDECKIIIYEPCADVFGMYLAEKYCRVIRK